jgi:hypothetical protein
MFSGSCFVTEPANSVRTEFAMHKLNCRGPSSVWAELDLRGIDSVLTLRVSRTMGAL